MKTFLCYTGFCLTALVAANLRADACDPRPGVVRPVPNAVQPAPVAPGPDMVSNDRGDNGGQIVWDLPAEEKARLRIAARVDSRSEPARSAVPAPTPTPARPTTGYTVTPNLFRPAPVAAPLPERVTRAIAAHKELTAAVERLMARRSEIERWDSIAQEKFMRAFGTIDDKVRQAVLVRIDQQLQESTRALAALSDSIRFEFYVSLNKKK